MYLVEMLLQSLGCLELVEGCTKENQSSGCGVTHGAAVEGGLAILLCSPCDSAMRLEEHIVK